MDDEGLGASDDVCPDPLWDTDTTWNTTNPNLTECFRHMVLSVAPTVVLVAALPFWTFSIASRCSMRTVEAGLSMSRMAWARTIVNVVLAISVCLEFLVTERNRLDGLYDSDLVHFVVVFVTFCLLQVMLIVERWARLITSPVLFAVWLLLLVCQLPTFKVQVESLLVSAELFPAVIAATFVPMLLVQLVLYSFVDRSQDEGMRLLEDGERAPEDLGSVLSYITFAWVGSLVHRGYKAALVQGDLPTNPDRIRSEENSAQFLKYWNEASEKQGRSKVGIWKIVLKLYLPRVLFATFLGIINYGLALVNPLVLRLIVLHLESDEETWKGVLYAAVLLVCAVIASVCFGHLAHQMTVVALQLRNAIAGAVFRKSLRLSNEARREFTSGEITNFVSVDSELLLDCVPYSLHLWLDPPLVTVVLALLYVEIGVAAFAGIAFLVLLIPINIWSSHKIEAVHEDYLGSKDERMKATNEAINGIQVLKMYAWEHPFMERIQKYRDREIKNLRSTAKLFTFSNLVFSCSPIFVTLLVFGIYIAIDENNVLSADKVFVCLSLFSVFRVPLEVFPIVLFDCIRIVVSVRRIGRFLNAEELDPDAVDANIEDPVVNAVEIADGVFSWSNDSGEEGEGGFVLSTGSLAIEKGSLVAIVGKVGSGKSSLLSALTGDMVKRSGRVSINGHVALIPQQAWILNMSVKNNIMFESGASADLYASAVEACALVEDLEVLPAGDETEIGENGVNLSGGQKQRVSMGRAVVLDRDVYLLDDPLSAVDAQVADHLFRDVISSETGLLRRKTRILVTHSITFLQKVDRIIVLGEGKIVEMGTYAELMANDEGFASFIADFCHEHDEASKRTLQEDRMTRQAQTRRQRMTLSYSEHAQAQREADAAASELLLASHEQQRPDAVPDVGFSGRLIEDETAMTGRVKTQVYLDYIRTVRTPTCIVLLIMFVFGQAFHAGGSIWLSVWADANEASDATVQPGLYLGVFAAMGVFEIVIAFTRQVMLRLSCAEASRTLHNSMLLRVIRAPMSFFNTTPTGRIANRFSSDLNRIDEDLPSEVTDFLWCFFEVTSTILIICYATPIFIAVISVLVIIFFAIVVYFIGASRQLKRLESLSESPILSTFHETLSGTASIRTFGCQERFVNRLETLIDSNVACHYNNRSSTYWLGLRMELLGSVIVFSSALLLVLRRGHVSGGTAGLALMYGFEILEALAWMVHMACNLEIKFVCVERILEYLRLPQEDDWQRGPVDPAWPQTGRVHFVDYATRYRDELDLVLSDINLLVPGKEKLGVCGRTGAGKSSLTLALFRIVEAAKGKIVIDDLDISCLGLHSLRSRLTIIPQDPVLFTGNVRFNLDPAEQFTDEAIWAALELAHLRDTVEAFSDKLGHEVSEGGKNFSVGQRQLLCLARALLRKTKILVLDEATASVDLETDSLIQTTIKEAFSDCTVITIAHRLNTILGYDRIAVLQDGRLKELDAPHVLINSPQSTFRAMAQEAGVVESVQQTNS